MKGSLVPMSLCLVLSACGGGGGGASDGGSQLQQVEAQISLSGQPASSINSQQSYLFQPQITTNTTGQSGQYSIENKPAWASFDPQNGRLSGTPGQSDAGSFNAIRITYQAGSASASIGPFNIAVINTKIFAAEQNTSFVALVNQGFNAQLETLVASNISYQLINAPSWLSINAQGQLQGQPGAGDIGQVSNIQINASSNGLSDSFGPLSISVQASNQAPQAQSQNLQLNFADTLRFNAPISDNEQSVSELNVSIIQQPQYGLISYANGEFSYEVFDLAALAQGDSFSYKVNDGLSDSATANINLSIAASAGNLSINTTPANQAQQISQQASIKLRSNQPLALNNLSVQSSNGSCYGDIQLSMDNFNSCLALNNASISQLNQVIEVSPKQNLAKQQSYQIKVAALDNYWQQQSSQAQTQSFVTENLGHLLISEVMPYFNNGTGWIELYNPSSQSINLGTFSLNSLGRNASNQIQNASFDLPDYDLAPGQFVVLHAQDPQRFFNNQAGLIFIGDNQQHWFSYQNQGYFELIENSDNGIISHDYMRFGSSNHSSNAWSGGSVAGSASNVQEAFIRTDLSSDNNNASDWQQVDFASPGGANDVLCTTDNDNDGIPDCSELPGSTYAGLPLYEWGARINQKDIFIEIDYMDASRSGTTSVDVAMRPSRKALEKVQAAFAAQNIAVHFDVGDYLDQNPGVNPANMDLGGGQEVPHSVGIGFSLSSHSDFYQYKRQYQDIRRSQIFHYLLLADTQKADGKAGSSGVAELPGNDIIVSLGRWGFSDHNDQQATYYANIQAATIMHELGHNLGLRHGGNQDTNYKPNYLSVMNYLYAIVGLPDLDNAADDRYLRNETYNNRHSCQQNQLSNNPYTDDFRIDYSSGAADSIDENNVRELDQQFGAGDYVDFNCNGQQDANAYRLNVNPDGDSSHGVLHDHNDWQAISLGFGKLHDTNVRKFTIKPPVELVSTKHHTERQAYVVETYHP